MPAPIGHNQGPELEAGQRVSIRTLWAKALFADPETPVYVMAISWAIHWYSKNDGTGAALSNQQLMDICGISERTATRGKQWLRDSGYIQLKVGTGGDKTQFKMAIPARVATETTLQQATPARQATQGRHTDHPRVDCVAVYNQERDSGPIQEKNKDDTRARRPKQEQGSQSFWAQALNPDHGVSFTNGKLTLLNGCLSEWLAKFDGDEQRLDLALIQIAPYLQPNSNRPLHAQVAAQLARIVAEKRDRDNRYERASQQARASPKSPANEHWRDKRDRENAEFLKVLRGEK